MRPAMKTLAAEHLALRGIARILHLDAKVIEEGGRIEGDLLGDIVSYIREFPDRIHHPKEEDFLFKAMRLRDPGAADLLDTLCREHREEHYLIAALSGAMADYKADPDRESQFCARAMRQYANFLDRHLEKENREAFPLAAKILTDMDWNIIDRGFADNDDPLAGALDKQAFDALHRRIMNLNLPPMGLS